LWACVCDDALHCCRPNIIRAHREGAGETDPRLVVAASKLSNAFFTSLVEDRLAERAKKADGR
jgi:hypothetical protein